MGARSNKLDIWINSCLRKKDYKAKFGVLGKSVLSKQICTAMETINKTKGQ